jgi:hypothetical protein
VFIFGVLVCVPQYPEKTLGWSPLEAGAGLLKMMLVVAAVPFAAGPPYHRVGGPVVIAAGAVCITVGALGRAPSVDISSVAIVPGLIICGAGVRAVLLRDHDAAITAHDTEDSSLAGGIVYMAQVGGASLGLGLNTAIVLSAAAFTDGIRNALVVDAALGLAFTLVAIALNRDRGQAVEALS